MEIGYFKGQCKCHLIVEFVGLLPKMNSFTVIDAEKYDLRLPVEPVQVIQKAVAKGVLRANIKRFTHNEYVTMFSDSDARKVTNRRIGLKLYQINNGTK